MKWLGSPTVGDLVEGLVKDAAFRNPGPMRSVSMRLPTEHEARIIVLSEMFGVQKGTLMRDMMMSAVLEAEDKLRADLWGDDEELKSDYYGRVQAYVEALDDGADHKPGDPEIRAEVIGVREAEEES